MQDFFTTFQTLCKMAEYSFDAFDVKEISPHYEDGIIHDLGHLMSITSTIAGMRGQYRSYRESMNITAFYVEVDGQVFDQDYLGKMEGHFIERFNKALKRFEESHPHIVKQFKDIWIRL